MNINPGPTNKDKINLKILMSFCEISTMRIKTVGYHKNTKVKILTKEILQFINR